MGWLRRLFRPLIDLAADVYTWYTAQDAWRASCAQVAKHVPDPSSGQRIVDGGCGPGVSTFEQARARPDAFVVGLDALPRLLLHARRLTETAGLRQQDVTWLCADATRLPIRTGTLAAVTAHSFLYYAAARDSVIREILRVLQPGGRFVTMEPSRSGASLGQILGLSRDPRFLISVALWRPFSRWHTRFTCASLCATLTQAGFINCDAEESLGALGIVAWAEKQSIAVSPIAPATADGRSMGS
jgi:ubiquinone/menaquinone biosynthesis C-methylase UbiE